MANILRGSYSTKLDEVSEKLGHPKDNYATEYATEYDERKGKKVQIQDVVRAGSEKENKGSTKQEKYGNR